MDGKGFIQVQSTTAERALPVPFAKVAISRVIDGKPVLQQYLETDENGIAPLVTVDTPSREFSETPGNAMPYAEYEVEVGQEGYFTQVLVGVQVFDGETSLVRADLTPLPENVDLSKIRTYIIEPHSLSGQGAALGTEGGNSNG